MLGAFPPLGDGKTRVRSSGYAHRTTSHGTLDSRQSNQHPQKVMGMDRVLEYVASQHVLLTQGHVMYRVCHAKCIAAVRRWDVGECRFWWLARLMQSMQRLCHVCKCRCVWVDVRGIDLASCNRRAKYLTRFPFRLARFGLGTRFAISNSRATANSTALSHTRLPRYSSSECRVFMARAIASNSSCEPSLFKSFARQAITQIFPFTYPFAGSFLSNEGAIGWARLSLTDSPMIKGFPKTGHTSGITMSAISIENSMPFLFARRLAEAQSVLGMFFFLHSLK